MKTQIMMVLGSFIVVLLVIVNTYPVLSMRDVVYADKEQSMRSTASVVSSALSGLDVLTVENVGAVVELLNLNQSNHILITNERRTVIYDSWGENLGTNLSATFGDMNKVFTGKMIFDSAYDTECFISQVCVPVMVNEKIIGSVYMVETDTEPAEMISGVRQQLTVLSVVIGAVAIVLSMALSHALTERIRRLASAVKIVQEGDYTHHIDLSGNDEITELTREFNAMTDILRQNEKERRQFVSDASHELKTPLASIRLLSDSILQSETIDRETTVEFVEDIGACADRLQLMTQKLLDLSRMDSDVQVERTAVDLGQLAQRCLPILRPLAEHRGITIAMDTNPAVRVFAAEEDLYQIVFNLVENAIKYNVDGGRVEVSVACQGDRAVLIVRDTGIGIPEADVPHVFSRFYRVDKARSREAGGSGLGLSIVQEAVILHGGQISVVPNVPSGTVFTVTFPIFNEGDTQ